MNYKDKLLRHYYIIGYLSTKSRQWNEIRNRLVDKLDNSLGDYSIRTFQRDLNSIREIFGIEISFNSTLKSYEISNQEIIKQKLNSLSHLIMSLNETSKNNYVLNDDFEGLGAVHLTDIMEAIANQYYIHFEYKKYDETRINRREVIPILLKENNKRWYLLGEDIHKEKLRVFGLDRIENLQIKFSRRKSKYSLTECAKLWNNTMGIEFGQAGQKAEIVLLRFDAVMAPYVKSLPWHSSQIIKDEKPTHSDFEMEVLITNDLINKIMSCVQFVTVLEPLHLKNTIINNLQQAIKNNK